MRIVAGEWRGRKLVAPKGEKTRPTGEKVREALFSILHDVEGLAVLDVFAGTGAIGIEALSRGAARACFVERHRSALSALRQNLDGVGAGEPRARVLAMDLRAALERLAREGARFHLVFADPPWSDADALVPELLTRAGGLLEDGGVIVVEHASAAAPTPPPAGFALSRTRKYGDTALSFYERSAT